MADPPEPPVAGTQRSADQSKPPVAENLANAKYPDSVVVDLAWVFIWVQCF